MSFHTLYSLFFGRALRRWDKGYYIRRLVHLVQKLFHQDKAASRYFRDRFTIVVRERTSRVPLLVVGSFSVFVACVFVRQLVVAVTCQRLRNNTTQAQTGASANDKRIDDQSPQENPDRVNGQV